MIYKSINNQIRGKIREAKAQELRDKCKTIEHVKDKSIGKYMSVEASKEEWRPKSVVTTKVLILKIFNLLQFLWGIFYYLSDLVTNLLLLVTIFAIGLFRLFIHAGFQIHFLLEKTLFQLFSVFDAIIAFILKLFFQLFYL